MNGRYLHPILHHFRNVENSESHGNDGIQGGFREIHSWANASPVAKTNLPRIALCWTLWRGDMPIRIEDEWIGIGLWIVQDVPIECQSK